MALIHEAVADPRSIGLSALALSELAPDWVVDRVVSNSVIEVAEAASLQMTARSLATQVFNREMGYLTWLD